MHATFKAFAKTARRIAKTRSRKAKIEICADYFCDLSEDQDLELAARFLGEGAFASLSGKRVAIGSRTYSTAAASFCEIDYEEVFKPCKKAMGHAIETIEILMRNIETARQRRKPANLPLTAIEPFYEALSKASSRTGKQDILRKAWKQMTPVEIKYFIRIMTRGGLSIGFEINDITAALAQAYEQKAEKVRYVQLITGSIGQAAVLCKNNRLHEADFTLFHPIPFMLAASAEVDVVENFDDYIAEEALDGIRCQVHISGRQVKIYSRDGNEITTVFPEIIDFLRDQNMPRIVLDGVICVVKDDCILSSQHLQKRLSLKTPSAAIISRYPALFIAFDLLCYQDTIFLNHPLKKRRSKLVDITRKYNLPMANQFEVGNTQKVNELLNRALPRGNTGLVLKKKASSYECGQRSNAWLKLKKNAGTLHTVILYAHTHSEEPQSYSHFTLGVRVDHDKRYEEEFIPIGKIKTHFTGSQKKQLYKKVKELTTERFGPTLGLIPKIVVELKFDDIQTNNRTKARYTLQRPRVKAIHWNLGLNEVDSLKKVEQMYDSKLNRNREKQGDDPSFYFKM